MATLLESWRKEAYSQEKDRGELQRFWADYFNIEQGIYEQLLEEPDREAKGTLTELAG